MNRQRLRASLDRLNTRSDGKRRPSTRMGSRRMWVAGAACAGLLALPALAEADATGRVRDAMHKRTGVRPQLSVDARGMHFRGLELQAKGRTLTLDRVSVRPSLDGIVVRLGDMRVSAPSDAPADPAQAPAQPADKAAADQTHPGYLSALVPRLSKLRGTPVYVIADASVFVEELAVELRLSDAKLALSPDLTVDGEMAASVHWGEGADPSRRGREGERLEMAVQAQLADDAAQIQGAYLTSTLGRVDGRAEVRGDKAAAEVKHHEGTIQVQAHGLLDRANAGATAQAQAWKLAALTPWLARAGIDAESVDLREAVIDGRVELSRAGPPDQKAWRVHFDDFSAHGLGLENARISPLPVHFARLALDGDMVYRRSPAGRSVELSTTLAHGTARASLAGHLSPERVDLDLEIAAMPCQGLLDSAPRGLLPALEGMRVAGQVSGQLGLHFDWAKVRDWATRSEAGEQLPSPGELSFAFPVVDRCRVTREAPGVDVAALKGAYRHRFVGEGGVLHERVLGMGAPNYAGLVTIPRVSRAFTILEDARFWDHDGFDLEHIERAVWHDFGVGRFARGASTITQQSARNLWLGVDRSLGRKVQEAFLAARLERTLDKRRIMELYMNVIELGPGVYGVEPAAQFYFGRPARDLNTIEALHLAALAPSPVRYAKRFVGGKVDDEWRAHLEEQVRRLRIHGFLNREQARAAKREPLALLDRR